MNRQGSEKKVKISRIAKIAEEIGSGRYPNSGELAAKMEVNSRTILRDIEYLKTMYDAPIEYDYFKKGFYYSEPNFFIKSIMLTEDEIETITIYDDFLKSTNSDEFNTKFRKVIGKIIAVLPENQTQDLPFAPSEENKNDFLFEPTVVLDGEIIQMLNNAIKDNEIIEVEYWVSDNRKYAINTLEPLNIFFERHHYYLLAWSNNNHKKPGIYSINRMRKLNTTGKHFKVPDNFKISSFIKKESDFYPADNKLFLFELSFPKEIASDAIEKIYHHNQTIELQKDGSIFVTFRSTQLHAVFHWVLGEGCRVKVLKPPELIAMVKNEIRKIEKMYD